MPLLVARKWPVVTRASAILRSRRSPLRSYTVLPSTTDLNEAAKRRTIYGGIIIPDSVHAHPHDLFNSVKPLPTVIAHKKSFAVFFVTPSYAHFLLDHDAFLRNALVQIYNKAIEAPHVDIHALCAVVDKLPVPHPWSGSTLESQLSRRKVGTPVAGTGFEGIAYISLPSSASIESDEYSLTSDQGTIDFITSSHILNDDICLDTLRLPLANTVFQTGMPTTMISSRWEKNSTSGELTKVMQKSPSHHTIRLAGDGPTPDTKSALNIPLLPLTLPRIVEGCMGNIIRRVIDTDGNSIQASSELENVVPRFFLSRGQQVQATVAWALVIPKYLKDTITEKTEKLLSSVPVEEKPTSISPNQAWERLWRSEPPVWNTLVSEALSEGARLHRVLSGGGGWGKKAGLLSLDPVPVNRSSGPGAPTSIDNTGNFESTLTPVVQDGDSIQFFTLPKSELAQEAHEADNYGTISTLSKVNNSWGWELGTIPSTMDSIPGESWQHTMTKKHRSTVFQGTFGALTEGALTMIRRRGKDVGETNSVYTTKLDVPFSRLWTTNLTNSHVDSTTRENLEQDDKDKDVGEPASE
ncbi:hypothetical protein COCC4DRAFT_127595 [Bipolaris maydis ATCC 48331]|uniref:Uncharacterized protein n=2 Tax=Cochliobolus heterostrophus TaxID=5016 RepID=M2URV5_COCH5|nr:uncharacterized protein COCC4DRAFT_127595 [Bipolaris maydis ATCC 48331]EMD90632.1 hypothetical protein COCHEDRAFT_1157632 [Bipolaris maydis C5]KAJ5023562.1 hypothetical protein J3E73DRAFT_194640 [Bipolaris maydis]ENI09157.1 hypothetical protein COCC4DRAFT_127595 [Bipolaris maydis ATCC 48331]KAJ5058496.1 hypothetical protein J3E74DRAFT_7203 [Bipolaris maydis]KAJ6195738.1 hypothetical protein J3E72DRAFT_7987 [Bipolaris maydis]